jgi:hypothetical protein
MNCSKHSQVVCVATCQSCSRGLCKECSDKYVDSICDSCNEVLLKRGRRIIIVEFASMLIVGYLVLRFMMGTSLSSVFGRGIYIYFYFGMALVGGFQTIVSRSDNSLEIRSAEVLIGALLGAMFVGVFVTPFRIIKKILRLKVIQKTLRIV